MYRKISEWVGVPHMGLLPAYFWACPHASIVTFVLVQLCTGEVRKLSQHIISGMGPLGGWAGVFHVKVGNNPTSKSLTWQSIHPFHTPVVLQPQSISMNSHGGCPVHYPLASMGWCPSLHQMHTILPAIPLKKMPTPTAHHLESSPIFSWHFGQHPWEKP